MMPVSEELEKVIRQHERLLISRDAYQEKLAQKNMVRGVFVSQVDMEIGSLRDALAVVVEQIAEMEATINELKAAQNGN